MNDYLRATSAECLKLKRTPVLLAAIIMPYLAVLLVFITTLSSSKDYIGWPQLGGDVLMFWAGLLLPILVSLTAASLSDLESQHQQWKHLFALPVSRGALYAAKQTGGFFLLVLSHGLLIVGTWMAGMALHFLRPNMQFQEPFPWQLWLTFTTAILASSGVILVFQMWLSLRMPSFILAVGLGLIATVFALTLGRLGDESLWNYFPWRWPMNALSNLGEQVVDPQWVLLGVGGGLLFATLGGWDFIRRDVA